MTKPCVNRQSTKKENRKKWCLVDFAVPAANRMKIRKVKKDCQNLRPCERRKMLRNMRVKVIPIVNGVLGTAPKE